MNKAPSPSLAGKRIRLLKTTDTFTELKPGVEGTVSFVDSIGTVHVDWDTGSKLGLCWDAGDRWNIVTPSVTRA